MAPECGGPSVPTPIGSDAPGARFGASGAIPQGGLGRGFDLGLSEERELGRSYPATLAGIEGGPPLPEPPAPARATLPGMGSKGKGCGDYRVVGWACWGHPEPWIPLARHECDRRECPDCARAHRASECDVGLSHLGGDWAHLEARTVTDKLDGYARTLPGYRAIRQVIVSPDPCRFDERGADHPRVVARVRSAAQKAVRELAWKGGEADYLSSGRSADGKRTGKETHRRGAFGSIVVHLYRGCEREGYDRWGPHAHVLCGGIDARLTEEYERRTGVVVKQAVDRHGQFVNYRGFRMRKHLVYELGHAAIIDGKHAVSYFGPGLIRYHPAEPEREESPAPTCPAPKCGRELIPLDRSFYSAGIVPFEGRPRGRGELTKTDPRTGRETRHRVRFYTVRGLRPPPSPWADRKRKPKENRY